MKSVKGYIERKTMLYITGVEYGDYTMNHIQGCSHGCKYPCYAFLMKKRFGQIKSYKDWVEPYIVSNTLELLEKEIPKLEDKIKSVQLCFSTDPFMYGYEEIKNLSIKAIKKLNKHNIKCTVLTKGVLPLELTTLDKRNEYGITLITLSEDYRKYKEPGAAPIKERIEALEKLHNEGCKTWISIEPYPTPNQIDQELYDILERVKFADRIIFGRTNYCPEVTTYKDNKLFYNKCANLVIDFCDNNGIEYHIKEKTMTNT